MIELADKRGELVLNTPVMTTTKIDTAIFGQALLWLQRYFVQPANNARAAFIVSLLLVLLLAHSAATMTWFLLTPEAVPVLAPPGALRTKPTTQGGELDKVADLHLFGRLPPQSSGPVTVQAVKAPETRLSLELNGVIAPEIPEISMAIIAAKGKAHKPYARGDKLPGNAILKEIYSDHVLLSRSGKLETLRIKKTHKPANIQVVPASTSATATSPVTQFKQELSSNPQMVWKKARLSMAKDPQTGRLQGYRVQYDDIALMQAVGLTPEDIITAVNGIPVTDAKAMLQLTRNPDSVKEVQLSILRDGQPHSLSIAIN
jgi:general secretion pathway protein C